MSETYPTDPAGSRDDTDAALDAALAIAGEDMLTAIGNGLDLDKGMAQVLKGLRSPATARSGAQTPAPEKGRGVPNTVISSRISALGADPPVQVNAATALIREVNASNAALEDLCLRARQAAAVASRRAHDADASAAFAHKAAVVYQTIQAEHPRRRAPLPRQVIIAVATVALDGAACYFAAQALNSGDTTTLVWTVLFLAVLAGGEVALNFYRDRNPRTWRTLVGLTLAFVLLLGALRFWFLAATGAGGLVPTIAGSCLFAAVTAGFLALGYRALRAAETPQAWRGRRQARRASRTARAAREAADQAVAYLDRLIEAYLGHVRQIALKTTPAHRQLAVEPAIRQYLSGELYLGKEEPRRPSEAPWQTPPGAATQDPSEFHGRS